MLCLEIFHVFLGPLYQIVFDDRSAPTTITDTAFKLARQAYLAQPTDQQLLSGTQVEPPPRQKQQSSRNRRNQEPTASSSTDSANITTSSVPPTTITSTVPIINSTTTTTTTTTTPCAIQECAEKCAPNSSVCTECSESERCYLYCPLHFTHTSHSNQSAPRRNNISNTIIIVPSITNNNNISNSNSSNSSSSSSSSSSTTNNNNIAISKITPPERHTPINIPITVPANSNTSSSTSATIVFNARGGPARKRKRYNPDSEEFCNCGCNQNYLYSCMSQCKGINCDNLVNRTCVSSTWLCSNCKPATENTKA